MKKLSQETVNKNVDYIVDGIKEVITTFGPRAPGSKGEADAQEYFAKELGKYADEVKTQKFTLHPMAFMGWIYFEVAFMLAALVCLWFNINIASILLGVTAITLVVLQLMLYIHVTAPFFPKKTSSNVYAVKKPTGEVKRRIIFCGHTDAAPEWGALYKGGAVLFETQFISSLLVVAVVIGMAIAGILVNGFTVFPQSINSTPLPYLIALIVVTVICTPIVIWLAFFFNPLRTVDGANDNLTANFTANVIRNVWSHAVIMCGHFPEGVETFETDSIEGETKDEWYVRQMLGSANIDGPPLMHIMTGNLSHQIEHHLFPDLPSNRYGEIAPRVREIFEKYDLAYVSGSL
ncbi:MAG TPA: acyl-CoA desaturase, partial [Clostridia bacterium]|nr:acyl-CoA desaturase [Clostridia bacterium]